MTDILLMLVVAVLLAINIAATRAVMQDDFSERPQKNIQAVLIWVVPLIGALLVLAVHRKAEKPSGTYRRDGDRVGDDFGRQRPGIRSVLDVLDED